MRTDGGSDAVVGGFEVGDPFTHGFVDGVFEGLGAGVDGDDLQHAKSAMTLAEPTSCQAHLPSQHPNPKHVQRLSPHILLTHIHHTLHPESSASRRGSDTMLTRTGLGDDPGLSESFGEKDLAESVIDLVGAGVVQVLSPV